jgi:hypothetical protein
MRRREFIALVGGVVWPYAVDAQQSGRLRRMGKVRVQAFRSEL